VRTFKRICIEDYTVQANNGDSLTLSRGKEYITSDHHEDGTVTVFANYWVRVRPSLFAGARIFTK
jgi:hypothetical protein